MGLHGTDQGNQMKSTSGWNNNGNGSNSSGFSALPGGRLHNTKGFENNGNTGSWWSATIYDIIDNITKIHCRQLYDAVSSVGWTGTPIDFGYSLRCIKD